MFEKCYDAKPKFGEVPLHSLDDREYWYRLKPYAEEILKDYPKEYVVLPASRYMDFWYNGNRKKYEDLYFINRQRLKALAILEAVKNDGKLLPDIIDGVWGMLDEATWCVPAHNGMGVGNADALPDMDDYVLDLYQSETGALLAELYYLFKDKFDEYSKNINKRLVKNLMDRVITPFNTNTEYWWMGFNAKKDDIINNWNPWITSNVLFVSLVLKEGSTIQKAAVVLDEYVKRNPKDGGCDEGPNYWFQAGVKLIEAASYMKYATGIDVTKDEMLKNCAEFNLKANLYGNVFANFADGTPMLNYIGGYYIATKVVGNEKLMDFAREVYTCAKTKGHLLNLRPDTLRQVLYTLEAISSFENQDKSQFVHDKSYYVESIQVKTIHKNAYDVAAKGGHNWESHNHNDVGNFIIAKNKELFIIDTGAMDYCKDTFSEKRYSIWAYQSQYHNLPEIGGNGQMPSVECAAKDVVNTENGLSLDIADAYGDKNIVKWVRNLEVCESGIKVTEDFEYQKSMDTVLHFMTQFEPKKEDFGLSLTSADGKKMEMYFNGDFTFDTISTGDDVKLNANWGKVLYRINIPMGEVKSGKFEYAFK